MVKYPQMKLVAALVVAILVHASVFAGAQAVVSPNSTKDDACCAAVDNVSSSLSGEDDKTHADAGVANAEERLAEARRLARELLATNLTSEANKSSRTVYWQYSSAVTEVWTALRQDNASEDETIDFLFSALQKCKANASRGEESAMSNFGVRRYGGTAFDIGTRNREWQIFGKWYPTLSENGKVRFRKRYRSLMGWEYGTDGKDLLDTESFWAKRDWVVRRHQIRKSEGALSSRVSLKRYLDEIRADQIPGAYDATHLSGWSGSPHLDLRMREREALAGWQYELKRELEDIANEMRFNTLGILPSRRSKMSDDVCREMGFSCIERHIVEDDMDWVSFRQIRVPFLNLEDVIPPYIPACPLDESWKSWRDRKIGIRCPIDGRTRIKDIFAAFDEYIGICTNRLKPGFDVEIESFGDEIKSRLSLAARLWLVRQYCLDYGDEDFCPWTLLINLGEELAGKAKTNDGLRGLEIFANEWVKNALSSAYFNRQFDSLDVVVRGGIDERLWHIRVSQNGPAQMSTNGKGQEDIWISDF